MGALLQKGRLNNWFYKPIKMPIFFVITKRIVTKTSEKEDHIL